MGLQQTKVGDRVMLLGLPDWLIHDLPEDEQAEMRSFINQVAEVQEVDAYGYIWIGFGRTSSERDVGQYSGHSFGVPAEFVQIIGSADSNSKCNTPPRGKR
jgi:hypothetical protein